MYYRFTKNKFTSLDKLRQHKKLSEILSNIYNDLLENNSDLKLQEHYNQILTWINESPLKLFEMETVSDRYHYHLKKSAMSKKEHNLLPHVSTQDNSISSPTLPISIYLDNIRSAHNIGSIFRTTEAYSLGEIYLSPHMANSENKQVRDASMGTWQWVKSQQISSTEKLQAPIIALETAENAIEIQDFIFPEKFTLVIGNEEYGCSNDLLKRADYVIKIPLYGKKNSLNVANAFTVAAYEITRQRGHKRCQ